MEGGNEGEREEIGRGYAGHDEAGGQALPGKWMAPKGCTALAAPIYLKTEETVGGARRRCHHASMHGFFISDDETN